MWQPRFFGILTGWPAAGMLSVFFFADDVVKAGIFGDACKQYGFASWNCGAMPKLAAWVPDTFIYLLKLPLTYDSSTDFLGAGFAFMTMGSSVAYALALIAVNYWSWKLNEL
jgi:hypothetical protein